MDLKDVVMGSLIGPVIYVAGMSIWGVEPSIVILPSIESEALQQCESRLGEMEYKYALILREMEKINDKLDSLSK